MGSLNLSPNSFHLNEVKRHIFEQLSGLADTTSFRLSNTLRLYHDFFYSFRIHSRILQGFRDSRDASREHHSRMSTSLTSERRKNLLSHSKQGSHPLQLHRLDSSFFRYDEVFPSL